MSNSVKWSELPDSTPLEYEQENQKRPGSKSHDLYERYKRSKTYGEAKANGARPEDFRHDYGKGWLKLQGGQIPLVAPKNGAKKDSEGSKRPKDGSSKKSKEDMEPIWQEEKRDPEQIQQDLMKQAELSKELNELKNDQYKKRERPKDAWEVAMEAFSKGSDQSRSSKKPRPTVAEAPSALDMKLEKAHKQLQKETMEQLEKARKEREKEKAEKAKAEAEKPKTLMGLSAAKAKKTEEKPEKPEKPAEKPSVKDRGKARVEKTPEKERAKEPEKGEKVLKVEKSEKVEKAEAKVEKKDKEKKLKKDKKEKKHKKDKKHKKHKKHKNHSDEKKSKLEGGKKAPRTSIPASRIRELLRSKVMGKDKGSSLFQQQVQEDAKLGGQPNGTTKPQAPDDEKEPSPPKEKAPDSLQEAVEVLQRQINELKPQQLEKLLECFKAEVTWRPDDVEDFNFDLKLLPVPKLRELTRLIARVRADTGSQLQAGVALDSNDRARFSAPVSQSTQLAAMKESHERELEDKIRVLEQQNEHQQRQIEEQKAQMMQMQAAQAQAQDPRFAPGQNTFGGSSSSIRPTWKESITTSVPHQIALQQPQAATGLAGQVPMRRPFTPGASPAQGGSELYSTNPKDGWRTGPAAARMPHELVPGWIGDGGGWVPGGEPPKNAQPPAVPPGDTEPPGRCMETCRCGQVVSRAWEVEKAWLKDEARAMAIMAAIQRFESHPSVERRGKVSKQNRYEPAAPTHQQALAEAGRVTLPPHLRMRAYPDVR